MTTPKTKLLGLGLIISAALPSPAFAMSWSHFLSFFKGSSNKPELTENSIEPSPTPSATAAPTLSIIPQVAAAPQTATAPETSGATYKSYGTGPSAPDGSKPFTMQSLMDIIQSNQVNSVDQLVPLLPQSYRSNFVLMFQSGSLQTATPKSPRVIAYGNTLPVETIYPGKNTDRLYIAFQTDTGASTKLPNSVEVIEWRPETKDYQFYQLDFPLTSNKITPLTTCKECHGTPLRPNWTAYPRWDGALGNGNGLTGNFSDRENYVHQDEANAAVDSVKKNNDRLKSFDLSAFEILDKIEIPAANMSGKIGSQLQTRDVEVIRNSPDYAKFKYAFAGAFMGCDNYSDFFDARTQDALQAGVYGNFVNVPKTLDVAQEDLTFAKLWQMTGALVQKDGTHFGSYSKEVAITTWLRFLLEGRGPDGTVILKNILGTPPFSSPKASPWTYDFVGFGDRATGLAEEYFKATAADFPDFGSLFSIEIQEAGFEINKYGVSDSMWTEVGPATEVCQQLASKSRNATAGYAVPSAKLLPLSTPSVGQQTQDPNESSSSVLPKFQKYCSTCHGADGDINLPLNDLEKLKAYRTSAGRSIEQRLLGKEMPPPSYPVQPSEDERKAMIEGLQN